MTYAQRTNVSEARSRAEIEEVIRKHLGRDAFFSYGTMAGRAAIQFSAHGRQIRFELPLPNREQALDRAGRTYRGKQCKAPTEREIEAWLDAEDRRRWRCMLLIIKAKLEAVALKLELFEGALTTEDKAEAFEREFLADVVVQDKTGAMKSLYEVIRGASLGGQRLLPAVKNG